MPQNMIPPDARGYEELPRDHWPHGARIRRFVHIPGLPKDWEADVCDRSGSDRRAPHDPGSRNGLPTKSIDGFSFALILPDADAPSTHDEQCAEFGGNRSFYRDGWKILTNHEPTTPFDDGEWELYGRPHRP